MVNDSVFSTNSIVYGKEAWKTLRELVIPKWGKSFREKMYSETKSKDFTYYLAVTKLNGTQLEKEQFEKESKFLECLKSNKLSKVEIKIITLNQVFDLFAVKGIRESIC